MTKYCDSDEELGGLMWEDRWKLLGHLQVSVLYHRKRERFLDLCDKFVKAVAVIAASSAVTPFVTGDALTIVQLIIVVSSTFSLVFDWSDRARRHSDFAVRYAQLERAVVATGTTDFSTDDLKAWSGDLYEIQSGEPAALHGLVQLCHDELDMAKGCKVEPERLSLRRKLMVHFGFGSMPHPEIPGAK
ncbi:hypothetical protein ABZR37_03860 [Achromobacter ruhlandii]|uniref:hypothetical protein n=1 Tax=Achromobacter ruhlandii TaxID=72557 RepID=UPI0035591B78